MNASVRFDYRNAVDRRGRRTPATLLVIDETRILLRRARQTYFARVPDRVAARQLRLAWSRYQAGPWRRTRIEATCPHQADKIEAVLWMLLWVRDRVLSEVAIRKIISEPGY